MWHGAGTEPGPHCGEASALSAAPTQLVSKLLLYSKVEVQGPHRERVETKQENAHKIRNVISVSSPILFPPSWIWFF